jgi:nitrogen regulatory protein PII-like uncharacterized protein
MRASLPRRRFFLLFLLSRITIMATEVQTPAPEKTKIPSITEQMEAARKISADIRQEAIAVRTIVDPRHWAQISQEFSDERSKYID